MEVYQHFIASAFIGASYWLFHSLTFRTGLIVFMTAVTAGTLIDLDHFVLDRFNRGSWRKLQKSLENPLKTVFSNQEVLGSNWLPPNQRLKSHTGELGLAIILYTLIPVHLTLVICISVAVHLLLDITGDVRENSLKW